MRNFKARRKRRNHWDAEQADHFISEPELPEDREKEFFEEDRPDWPEDDEREI